MERLSMEHSVFESESPFKELDQVQEPNNKHFIKANTKLVGLDELQHQHIIPVFAKDNEPTISHTDFISSVEQVISYVFGFHTPPTVRVSHPIKGRIPEAKGKPSKELLPHEKTLYYERMMFVCEVPSVVESVNGNPLNLTVGGVKSYNQDNLYSKKGVDEHFKFFIGFKNQVCTNLCVSTDGYKGDLKVKSLQELTDNIYHTVKSYNQDKHLGMMSSLCNSSLTESQFAQLIGKTRLYNYIDKPQKQQLPKFLLNDSQVNAVARDYYSDESFCRDNVGDINLWNLYNLFTGANKSSYIDSFLDRTVNSLEFVNYLHQSLKQDEYSWFLN